VIHVQAEQYDLYTSFCFKLTVSFHCAYRLNPHFVIISSEPTYRGEYKDAANYHCNGLENSLRECPYFDGIANERCDPVNVVCQGNYI